MKWGLFRFSKSNLNLVQIYQLHRRFVQVYTFVIIWILYTKENLADFGSLIGLNPVQTELWCNLKGDLRMNFDIELVDQICMVLHLDQFWDWTDPPKAQCIWRQILKGMETLFTAVHVGELLGICPPRQIS